MKILFFGTPYFAEVVLKGMLDNGFEVVGVVCQNDKPAGRGKKMVSPAIVEIAKANGFSESKVKSVLFRLRNKLRTFLESEGITV